MYYNTTMEYMLVLIKPIPYPAPRVHQVEGNMCEITWETIQPMRGDPISYVLQVLVGRESEYKQVGVAHMHTDRKSVV